MEEPWYRDREAVEAAIALHGSVRAAARATGVGRSTLHGWLDPESRKAARRRYNASEKGKAARRRYNASEKGKANMEAVKRRRKISGKDRAIRLRYRAKAREAGLCPKCCVREAGFGGTKCERCARYQAEYDWLGYSSIPLARGSEG